MDELKPCPFCGSEDVEHLPDGFGNWLVGCVTCDYRIQCVSCTEDEVIRYWNIRPAEDAMKAEVERLKETLNKIKTHCESEIEFGSMWSSCAYKMILEIIKATSQESSEGKR